MEFSISKIASIFVVSTPTILRIMKKNNWKRRTISETNHMRDITEETKRKMSKSHIGIQSNENNSNWKGNNIKSIPSLHNWVAKNKPKPDLCEECREKKKLELSFNHLLGEHTRDVEDYKYLCHSCHLKRDYKMGIRQICFNKIVGNRKF